VQDALSLKFRAFCGMLNWICQSQSDITEPVSTLCRRKNRPVPCHSAMFLVAATRAPTKREKRQKPAGKRDSLRTTTVYLTDTYAATATAKSSSITTREVGSCVEPALFLFPPEARHPATALVEAGKANYADAPR